VVDDEPDVEALFRQQFRRDLRAQRFVMDFAVSADDARVRIAGTIEHSLVLILSEINMPGRTGFPLQTVLYTDRAAHRDNARVKKLAHRDLTIFTTMISAQLEAFFAPAPVVLQALIETV
jgi:hypothetical protein